MLLYTTLASGESGYFHVGICVGYNHSVTPIINAHTENRYHVPYTFNSDAPVKVLPLFNTNLLGTTPISETIINLTQAGHSINITLDAILTHIIQQILQR